MLSAAPTQCERDQARDDRTRRLFLVIRRALLMICAAIEKEFGTEPPEAVR